MEIAIIPATLSGHDGEWWLLTALREFAILVTEDGGLDIVDMPSEGSIIRIIASTEILEVFLVDHTRNRAFLEALII